MTCFLSFFDRAISSLSSLPLLLSSSHPTSTAKPRRLSHFFDSYNRPEDDFDSRAEFDDYLEQREDLSEYCQR